MSEILNKPVGVYRHIEDKVGHIFTLEKFLNGVKSTILLSFKNKFFKFLHFLESFLKKSTLVSLFRDRSRTSKSYKGILLNIEALSISLLSKYRHLIES